MRLTDALRSFAVVAVVAASAAAQDDPSFESATAGSGAPAGWQVSGEGYALAVRDGTAADGDRSLEIRIDSPRGFARVTQRIPARAGIASTSAAERVRLGAWLQALDEPPGTAPIGTAPIGAAPIGTAPTGAEPPGAEPPGAVARGTAPAGTATLRLRIDGVEGLLYVDGARAEIVSGAWRRYAIEAPVFAEAAWIEIGATFRGPGTFRMDGFALEAVDLATRPPPSAAARHYLDAALDLLERHSVRRNAIEWPALRAAAARQLRGAATPADAYLAVRYALGRLGDHHSYLLDPERSATLDAEPVSNARTGRRALAPRGRMLDGGVAYLWLPGFAGGSPAAQVEFAEALQDSIRRLDAAACGWIVDLRENSGGNVWPMLLGLGPLMGDGVAAAAVYPDGRSVPLWYRGGRVGLGEYVQLRVTAPYRTLREAPTVAVLLGSRTASSGEIVAAAFRGSAKHRFFGAPTRGLATGNKTFVLADGATLVLTVAATSDRTGALVLGPLEPDEAVAEPAAADAAAEWLRQRCQG